MITSALRLKVGELLTSKELQARPVPPERSLLDEPDPFAPQLGMKN
jgi:hypothetical protein